MATLKIARSGDLGCYLCSCASAMATVPSPFAGRDSPVLQQEAPSGVINSHLASLGTTEAQSALALPTLPPRGLRRATHSHGWAPGSFTDRKEIHHVSEEMTGTTNAGS